MNYVLFAIMDQVSSLKKTKQKKNWKNEKITGEVREFSKSRKGGNMFDFVRSVRRRHPCSISYALRSR